MDLEWDDDEVVKWPLRRDTEFVFDKMTRVTLAEVGRGDPQTILDVGCGRGLDACSLSCPGRLVVGLEPSRTMLGLAQENDIEGRVLLVQGIAEHPPFKDSVFDRIMCKGALDHFFDPAGCTNSLHEKLKPGGKLVVAVANFESLSCLLSRRLTPLLQKLSGKGNARREFWEPPDDHLYVFNYANLKDLLSQRFEIQKMEGVSIMWGFPYWGDFLNMLPPGITRGILSVMGRIAARLPFLSDVIVVVAGR